jgi:hypothetical protein
VFAVVFGSDAAAAWFFRVSKMTVWRMRHNRTPLPEWVSNILPDLLQTKVAEVHQAQQDFRYFFLSRLDHCASCCAGRARKLKRIPLTAEDWDAAFGV